MNTRPYLLHALSPLHAGTGQAAALIDLPIARMRATGIPFVPGSSVKGVLREAARGKEHEAAVFGPRRDGVEGDTAAALDHAGALIVGDARLLLLPVRSFSGTFALVTSPLLLRLAQRDLQEGGVAAPAAPAIEKPGARVASLGAHRNVYPPKKKIYLEELDLDVREDPAAAAWEQLLVAALPDEAPVFQGRLVVVDDETMTFLWETATQIDTRVRLQPETGTVAQGALWTEESLPPETLLIGVLAAQPSMRPGQAPLPAERVLELALPEKPFLQFGGKATVGRGRCRIHPLGQGGRR